MLLTFLYHRINSEKYSNPWMVIEENIKYLAKPIINMKIGGTSTKSIKNIITSNLEVFEILKSFKIRNYYQIIFFKIIRKFLQIRLK